MRMRAIIPATAICFVVALLLTACGDRRSDTRKIKFYQSPMHPWITSDKPGNCTICGMDLVPVHEGEEAANADASKNIVPLNPDSVRILNVTTVPARRMELIKTLRFSGILEDNENIHRIIAAFYDGRIEQIYVEHVGEYVEKGAPLASIYSPELLYVVREYQTAARSGDAGLVRSAARRLVQFGLTPEQVESLGKRKDDVYTVDLLAPISGTVLVKKAFRGQYIKTGEPLFEMGDLSRLWFHAEVYERDLSSVRVGQKAVIRTPTVPGREFPGVVTFIDPNFDPATRSTKVRIEVDNPLSDDGGLRRLLPHRAYAEADITADLGEALVLPRSAVLRDGRRSLVYVQNSEGRYEPRNVETGLGGDEGIQILSGVAEGERVVTVGNLMIDAEAQIRGHIKEPPAREHAQHPPQEEAAAFLRQLAKVSDALAADDAVAAVASARELSPLAAAIPELGDPAVDQAVHALHGVKGAFAGDDLKALRKAFLPWSQPGAELAEALVKSGRDSGVLIFECPMTGDSFPGAPAKARWVQIGHETLNPFFGAEMRNCGAEIKP